MTATLYVVATPIGNIGDLSRRAREILAAVDVVACEDTRRTGKLFELAAITRPRLLRLDGHTEHGRADQVLDLLAEGRDVALVSDAGTPLISDPGAHLVTEVVAAGHTVTAVPGPAAPIAALVVSGLATDRFMFEGFLPRRGQARTDRLRAVAASDVTSVLFESPRRVTATLADLATVCGPDRRVSVSRELTKLHEETVRGTLAELEERFADDVRGEIVVVVAGADEPDSAGERTVTDALVARRDLGLDRRSAVAVVVADTGAAKRFVYDLSLGVEWPTAER